MREPILPVRIWRLGPWNSNPLMRGSDRFEGSIRLLVIGLMLIMVSVAGAAGTARYSGRAEQIRIDNAQKVDVPAIVLGQPEIAAAHNPYRTDRFEAPVRWTRNGETATATVTVDGTAKVGSEVRVWLGADGKPTDPPKPSAAAVSAGIGTSVGVLLLAWLGGWALAWIVGAILNSRRNAQWDAEWRRIDRRIGA